MVAGIVLTVLGAVLLVANKQFARLAAAGRSITPLSGLDKEFDTTPHTSDRALAIVVAAVVFGIGIVILA